MTTINVRRIAELSLQAVQLEQRRELVLENIQRLAKGKDEIAMDEPKPKPAPAERRPRRSRMNVEVLAQAGAVAPGQPGGGPAAGDMRAPVEVKMVDHDADRVDPREDAGPVPDYLKRGVGAAIPATTAAYEQALKS